MPGTKKPPFELDPSCSKRAMIKGSKDASADKLNSYRNEFNRFIAYRDGKKHGANLAFCKLLDPTVPDSRDEKDGKRGYRTHKTYMAFDWYYRQFQDPPTEEKLIKNAKGEDETVTVIAGTDTVVPPKRKSAWQALKPGGGVVKYIAAVDKRLTAAGVDYSQKDIRQDLLTSGMTTKQADRMCELVEDFLRIS